MNPKETERFIEEMESAIEDFGIDRSDQYGDTDLHSLLDFDVVIDDNYKLLAALEEARPLISDSLDPSKGSQVSNLRDFLYHSSERARDPIRLAMNTLKIACQQDQDYAWSWHCNLAVASMDEGLDHEHANKAAARFMYSAFSIDTTKFKEYQDFGYK